MKREIIEKANTLIKAIKNVEENLEVLKEIQDCLANGNVAELSAENAEYLLEIPSIVATQCLKEEKPRLEAKLKKLETEFDGL